MKTTKKHRILHRCNNSLAFIHATSNWDGFECDVRLHPEGYLVLAHDKADVQLNVRLEYALDIAAATHKVIALNVKEHGLCTPLTQLLSGYADLDYFIFDVPGPELHYYHRSGLKIYGRVSEYELQQPTAGWLVDAIDGDQATLLNEYVGATTATKIEAPVALISHGCHGRIDRHNEFLGVTALIGKADELERWGAQEQ